MTCQEMQGMAMEILRITNDGDDLLEGELKLVEWAANCNLSIKGERALLELRSKYAEVQNE